MSLPPWLKDKERAQPGLIVKTRAPDEDKQPEESEESEAIKAAANELIRAVHARDAKAVAAALKDAFTILDAEPHIEGEHLNESEQE